jgi:hypothetical protein
MPSDRLIRYTKTREHKTKLCINKRSIKRNKNYCVVTRVLGAAVLEKTNRNECILICQASERKGIATTATTAQRKMLSSYGGAGRLKHETKWEFHSTCKGTRGPYLQTGCSKKVDRGR